MEVKGTVYERALKSFGGDVKAWKVVVYPKKVSNDAKTVVETIIGYIDESRNHLKFLNEKGYTDRDLVNKIELLEINYN